MPVVQTQDEMMLLSKSHKAMYVRMCHVLAACHGWIRQYNKRKVSARISGLVCDDGERGDAQLGS